MDPHETPDSLALPGAAASGTASVVAGRRNPAGLVLAVLSFAVTASIVVVGLYVLVTSK